MSGAIHSLHWKDVAPSKRGPFDPSQARTLALEVTRAAASAVKKLDAVDRVKTAAALDRAFLAAYGAWVAGWDWAASEPGGGGPIKGWCCERDSILRKDDLAAADPVAASAERAARAVIEWNDFLIELESLFRELTPAESADGTPSSSDIARDVERAAGRLVTLVVTRTGAEDAWYATFARLLDWYIESRGIDGASALVAEVASGRFSSWVAPDEATTQQACADIANAVANASRGERAGAATDALALWLEMRSTAFSSFQSARASAYEPIRADGHRGYIHKFDRARDPERADAMEVALDACRASAERGEDLTFDRLAAWQGIVLGEAGPATFRSGEAWAKRGRERYGLARDTRERFEQCLADANNHDLVVVRAARAYLDVCFFHPFEDGNARAARLALDHVLTRHGLGLHTAEPLFLIPRNVEDGAWQWTRLVDHLMGTRL